MRPRNRFTLSIGAAALAAACWLSPSPASATAGEVGSCVGGAVTNADGSVDITNEVDFIVGDQYFDAGCVTVNSVSGVKLVFSDAIENVPEEYRQVGTSILMENDSGQTRSFIVTRMDDKTLTVDGNNPLCGREVVFRLEVLTVRDATDEETRAGGPIVAQAAIDPSLMRPV